MRGGTFPSFFDCRDDAFPARTSRFVVRARRRKGKRRNVLGAKSLQVALRLAPEADHRCVRQHYELSSQVMSGAMWVGCTPDLILDRVEPSLREPRMSQLFVEAQFRVQPGQEPTNIPVEKVGAVPVAVMDVAKTVLEHTRGGVVGVVRLVVVRVPRLGEHHDDLDVGELSGRPEEAARDMALLRVPDGLAAGTKVCARLVSLDERVEELSIGAVLGHGVRGRSETHSVNRQSQYDFRTECISGDMSPRDREAALSRFSADEIDMVTSVDLLNEGLDVPDVDLVVFMRATHSRRIFVQQLGRGLRVAPGKRKVVVLDFVSDLKRIREVVELDQVVRGAHVESLELGPNLIDFADVKAGDFMREWVMDQASLRARMGSVRLQLPPFEFPSTSPYGNVQ